MSQLLLSNVPWNCQESEVRLWVESNGFPVAAVHVIRDLVTNASPAFAYVTLRDNTQIISAIRALHGQKLKDRTMQVEEDWRIGQQVQGSIGSCQTHE